MTIRIPTEEFPIIFSETVERIFVTLWANSIRPPRKTEWIYGRMHVEVMRKALSHILGQEVPMSDCLTALKEDEFKIEAGGWFAVRFKKRVWNDDPTLFEVAARGFRRNVPGVYQPFTAPLPPLG